MKKLTAVFLLTFLIAVLIGCSAPNYASDDYYAQSEASAPEEAAYDQDEAGYAQEPEFADGEASMSDGPNIDYDSSMLSPSVNRKVIFSGYLGIQTTTFDEAYKNMMDALKEFDGYVEHSSLSGKKPEKWNESGRVANLTFRVPSKRFDAFIEKLKGMGETISVQTSGDDISLQYFDSETRLKTLRTREERLLDLLEEAKGLEDIISLEKELADVAYQIQLLEVELRNYDSLIDYSTINIELREVNQVERVTASEKENLGTRIKSGFFSVLNVLTDIGEGLLIFIIAGSPVLVPLALILILVLVLLKRRRSKKRKANQPPQNQ